MSDTVEDHQTCREAVQHALPHLAPALADDVTELTEAYEERELQEQFLQACVSAAFCDCLPAFLASLRRYAPSPASVAADYRAGSGATVARNFLTWCRAIVRCLAGDRWDAYERQALVEAYRVDPRFGALRYGVHPPP